jgi:hypothetical protein
LYAAVCFPRADATILHARPCPTPQTACVTNRSCLARTTFHFTQTSCSSANPVEGCFAKLTRQRLKRGVVNSIVGLQIDINRFVADANDRPEPSGSNPSAPFSPLSSARAKRYKLSASSSAKSKLPFCRLGQIAPIDSSIRKMLPKQF